MIVVPGQPHVPGAGAQPPAGGALPEALRAELAAHPSRYLVIIDSDLCIGAATCVDLAPRTFALDGENKAVVLGGPWDDDARVLDAAKSCPTLAVIVKDRATGAQVFPA